jgi:hypothetical protein
MEIAVRIFLGLKGKQVKKIDPEPVPVVSTAPAKPKNTGLDDPPEETPPSASNPMDRFGSDLIGFWGRQIDWILNPTIPTPVAPRRNRPQPGTIVVPGYWWVPPTVVP